MTYRRALYQLATAMGFALHRSRQHLVWQHERTGVLVSTSSSPSDCNAINQAQRQFRRALQHHATACIQ